LTYNLLTAYTSFVAIDTQIRLKGGQTIMVKQPLPLPQGVSNYAVGSRSFAEKGICLATPSSGAMPLKMRVREESHKYNKEGHLDSESANKLAGIEVNHIQLKNIAVTEGLSKNSTRKLIEKNIHLINRCYKATANKQADSKGKVVFTLVVDRQGRVIKVNVTSCKKGTKDIEHCIIQKIKKLHFPAPEKGENVTVTITFVLR
jgi:Ca-activated chloride channel family protein